MNIPVLLNHNTSEVIGRMYEDDDGSVFIEFLEPVPKSRIVNSLNAGYMIVEAKDGLIKKIEIFEISIS